LSAIDIESRPFERKNTFPGVLPTYEVEIAIHGRAHRPDPTLYRNHQPRRLVVVPHTTNLRGWWCRERFILQHSSQNPSTGLAHVA